MNLRVNNLIGNWLLLLAFSYIFNFIWESWHGVYLYEKHDVLASQYVPMVNFVSILDALAILGIYMIAALFLKDFFWIKNLTKFKIATFLVLSLIVAFIIEYICVYSLKWWAYNSFMPLLAGIGISPLIQLAVTGIVSIVLTSKVFGREGGKDAR